MDLHCFESGTVYLKFMGFQCTLYQIQIEQPFSMELGQIMHKSVEEKAKNFPYQQVNTGYSVNLSNGLVLL
jgi:hypothetical protein